MRADHAFSRAVDAVADGRAVDWDLLDSQASGDEEREQLKWLRVLGDLAELHRPGDEADEAQARAASNDGRVAGEPPTVAEGEDDWGYGDPDPDAMDADGAEGDEAIQGEPVTVGPVAPGAGLFGAGPFGAGLFGADPFGAERLGPAALDPPTVDPIWGVADDPDQMSADDDVPPASTTAVAPLVGRRSASAPAARGALRRWGRFHLLEQVGEGSFGRVYRAWDPQLEREVAIKILHAHYTAERLHERLLREGRALAKVRHANVVNVHAVESHEGRVGLCMEFVRGLTLDDALAHDGVFGVDEMVRVGRDVCQALAAVHRAGFLHRDVKARNVMREDAGRLVLMDFGTGQDVRLSEAERLRDRAGTPLYMAPEVLAGGEESPASDVYSVGVLLFHLLTNEYPVQAADVEGLRAVHARGTGPAPLRTRRGDTPVRLARIVDRALAPRVEDRFPHPNALCQALDQAYPADAARGWRRWLVVAPLVLAGALLAAFVLGTLTSVAFNNSLGRAGFVQETFGDRLVWGLKASVAPVFVFAVAWLLSACTMGLIQLLLRLSGRAAAFDTLLRARLRGFARRWALDDATVVASLVLILSAAALVALWWRFMPLVEAMSSSISVGAPALLALLSPAFEAEQDLYRQSFTLLLFAGGVSWYAVARMASRQRRPLGAGLVAGALVVIGLTLASLDVPYRLLIHSKFEMARWNGAACHMLGQRGADTLLTCAGLDLPRNRVAPSTEVEPLGRVENVYTPFASARAK